MNEFSHEDIINEKISYVIRNQPYPLTGASNLEDYIDLELRAGKSQPAQIQLKVILVPMSGPIVNSKNSEKSDSSLTEFKYLNMVVTGSQLLIIAICVFTALGLCMLLMMVRLLSFGKDKSSKTSSSSSSCSSSSRRKRDEADRHCVQDSSPSDLLMDDSGRGSLPYDRASTVMSELNPYLPNIIQNNAPSISTNCGSIRSNTGTPVSTFGRGKYVRISTW